jgi:hypothetical protein
MDLQASFDLEVEPLADLLSLTVIQGELPCTLLFTEPMIMLRCTMHPAPVSLYSEYCAQRELFCEVPT